MPWSDGLVSVETIYDIPTLSQNVTCLYISRFYFDHRLDQYYTDLCDIENIPYEASF
jgi:hypothetical protein